MSWGQSQTTRQTNVAHAPTNAGDSQWRARRATAVLLLVATVWVVSCSDEHDNGGIGPERATELRACLDGDKDIGKCGEVAQYAKARGTTRLRAVIADLLDCINETAVEPLLSSPLCIDQQTQVRAAL
jgi:hypothetical protein